ncbi:Endonuclease/exonuclease/phosphatase [Suillus subalutaceus]|uniref:Endonuclease/exonuclease/phosphatase n=1 Tax=Suillus subalutaceus TaxID=48586 RepID=UPI001B87E5DA|nr:Endonuclease/exonuclease/phosphatase [Suillus subalutaceus]KAG1875469.1 Endonuclease/exonuclease/phosphatase [Suillus subalutaceus]
MHLGQNQISKWTTINREMREKQIGILCVQETHLCPEHQTQIDTLYARRLVVLNSSDTTRPCSSAGIAFILNKEIINTTNTKIQVLIPGRAALLSIKWHENNIIKILNVYAPNNPNEHLNFWNKIKSEWLKLSLDAPDLMMGDFNLTEDPIDWAPARFDNEATIDALCDLRTTLQVQDTWRIAHPHCRIFTFSSNHQTLSRLDRIYVSERHATSLIDWDSHICQIPTDHHLVSVRLAPPNLPHIGKGHWSWPQGLVTNTDLMDKVITLGIKAQADIENPTPHTNEINPQRIWCSLKNDMNTIARDTAKTHLHKINQRIHSLTKDMRKLANDRNIDGSEDVRLNEILLEKEISHLQKRTLKRPPSVHKHNGLHMVRPSVSTGPK